MLFHLWKNDQHSTENFPWTLWPCCTSHVLPSCSIVTAATLTAGFFWLLQLRPAVRLSAPSGCDVNADDRWAPRKKHVSLYVFFTCILTLILFKIWLLTWYKMYLDFGYTYTVYGYRSKWYHLCLKCFSTNIYKKIVMHKDILSRRITTKTTVECVTTWHGESVCVPSVCLPSTKAALRHIGRFLSFTTSKCGLNCRCINYSWRCRLKNKPDVTEEVKALPTLLLVDDSLMSKHRCVFLFHCNQHDKNILGHICQDSEKGRQTIFIQGKGQRLRHPQ